jgi:hypothetical protein
MPQDMVTVNASNFSYISNGNEIFYLNNDISGSLGGGCMSVYNTGNDIGGGYLSYPFVFNENQTYYVYIRCQNSNSNDVFTLMIDGNVQSQINLTSSNEWQFLFATITIPDNNLHEIQISFSNKNTYFDCFTISSTLLNNPSIISEISTSPYFNLHLQVYEFNNEVIGNKVNLYYYKNSINDLKTDDWYNFYTLTYDQSIPSINNYAYVLSSTGALQNNYCVWQWTDFSEYVLNPCGILL